MIKAKFIIQFVEIIIFVVLIIFYSQHTLILSDPSRLYSTSIAHRLQTDALLKGSFSLSPQPFGIPCDFLWSGQHGIQQAWGLGVPLLRLPFEWIARQCGFEFFPDRLVILFYLVLVIVMLNISLRLILPAFGIPVSSIIGTVIRIYIIMWVLFCPPMSNLIQQGQQGLNVYKETVFYGDMYGNILLALLLIYSIRPTKRNFIVLCLLSGLAWLIRPTIIVYGGVTLGIAVVQAFQNKNGKRLIGIGLLCFLVGVLLELWTNYFRFGSIWEFGYPGIIGNFPYLEKFGGPFQQEPLLSAFKELVGALFFNNAWVSHTFRYREVDVFQFNISHLIVLGVGFIFVICLILPGGLTRIKQYYKNLLCFRIVYLLLFWGIICFGVLFTFYMHYALYSSRYLAELAIAYNAILIALILSGLSFITTCWNWKKYIILFFIFTGPFFFFNNELFLTHKEISITNDLSPSTNKAGVQKILNSFYREVSLKYDLPESFYCGHTYSLPGLNYQFSGWNIVQDCTVSAITVFFLPSKECLSINYSIWIHQPMPRIKVKRDFQLLKSRNIKIQNNSQNSTVTQNFCSNVSLSNKPALYAIRWVSPERLGQNNSLVKLNWVNVADEK